MLPKDLANNPKTPSEWQAAAGLAFQKIDKQKIDKH